MKRKRETKSSRLGNRAREIKAECKRRAGKGEREEERAQQRYL